MSNKETGVNPSVLPFTGERYVPKLGGSIELEHLHRYLTAKQVVAGKAVLDIACGEGYGSAILAQLADKVTGVDISAEAVSHARTKYRSSNLEFLAGSCAAIPLADASIDVVVSFETIEHHDQHEEMMREIKRVLRPGGALIISCPDKLEYSERPGYSNPYHVKELYRDEFVRLLSSHFRNQYIYGQRVAYGSLIFSEKCETGVGGYQLSDDALSFTLGVPHAVYLLAVASDAEPPRLNSGLLEQSISEAELVNTLKGQVAGLSEILNGIYSSSSWKLSRPLRFFERLFREPRSLLARIIK